MTAPRPPAALVLAVLALALLAPGRPAHAAATPLTLAPCRLEQVARVQSFAAECGMLSVPEDAAAPAGRRIELFVARVPAISRRKLPDPLFVVAGGPGQSAAELYASVAPVFARIGRERDIVLVDQRGTGRSQLLACAFDENSMLEAGRAEIAGEARRCRDSLARHADLRQYTTSVAVLDLERVRQALGYGRINLYGISYGTRVTQHYARRYPQATRAVILDGVVAPQTLLGPAMAIDAQAALERILRRCVADAACRYSFHDPAADYASLERALAQAPVALRIADPRSGEPRSFQFTANHLAAVLRLASYSAEQAALLPLALHLARAESDYAPLGAQYLLAERSLENALAVGMQNSVICTEDLPFVDAARIDVRGLAATYLGATQLEGLQAICGQWPRGVLDADFHAPLASAAPALLLSGADDPVTPPEQAALAARGFADHAHIVMPGLGHGQLGAPCIDRLMAAFLNAGTARGLDASCTQRVRPMPFFTSRAGPAP